MIEGRTAQEMDPNSVAANEIAELWDWLSAMSDWARLQLCTKEQHEETNHSAADFLQNMAEDLHPLTARQTNEQAAKQSHDKTTFNTHRP